MSTAISCLLRLAAGMYFVFTSLYCLLAFLPYTYAALIKAPAYEWMPWLVQHQAALYWAAVLPIAVTHWRGRDDRVYFGVLAALALAATYVTFHPFLATVQNDQSAYVWSLVSLAPLALFAFLGLRNYSPPATEASDSSVFAYSGAVLAAAVVSLVYVVGAEARHYAETKVISLHPADLELAAWSVLSHLVLATAVLTVLNLVRLLAKRTGRPAAFRFGLTLALVIAALSFALARFLSNSLGFEGWPAQLYAAALAATLTLFGVSLALPWLRRVPADGENRAPWKAVAVMVIAAAIALLLPFAIHDSDWNGFLEATFTVAFWLAVGICVYRMRPRWAKHSVATVVAVFLLSAFVYKGLQFSAIFWGKPLGTTDDDVARQMETYAGQDASFALVHRLLGNSRAEPCGDLCRALREYTNLRGIELRNDINLVDTLAPTTASRPNIFLLVIDSMRPDYLGAYNPAVDFTPNLDAFARDSVVLHHAFTQYAGTTLSEPAIWTGAMLLRGQYVRPFPKVNGLEKLARTDGYQMVVSYDTVLSQLLSPSDDLIKIDTDKKLWNEFEICSTVQELEQVLDSRKDKSRPVLFYTQPMNVHQFARNHAPSAKESNWRMRPGFNNRIAYAVSYVDHCLGGLFGYLKARGMYDNSIVIVTSDHGDATGELGRFSHALSPYPEVMRVPMIVHLPPQMRKSVVYDETRISTLTDITPSLYYLLGHRPIRQNPLLGRPLFAATKAELESYRRDEYLLASDVRPAYGLLADNGRLLYFTVDSPRESFLYDLGTDPKGERNVVTGALEKQYDERIIQQLQAVADFYGYKPGLGSFVAAVRK